MRIESVTAHAFGPLAGQALELAPGMTVIAGVNESAKSSWHAAIYAALCGRRRGRGAPTKPERIFIERHKPWNGGDWRVSAVIELDDGRRVELSQDLNGKVDCRATDVALGRDISNEVMFEGSPDASRWLGLDRKSFAATACVSQAQLLSVLSEADGLQQHLQRAAATAGTDATAAAALERLDVFHRDNVGLDRVNSIKPLRVAKNRLQQAEADLSRARQEHEEYLILVERTDNCKREAEAGTQRARSAEKVAKALGDLLTTAQAWSSALEKAERAQEKVKAHAVDLGRVSKRVARARELDARFGGVQPAGLTAQEELTRKVNEALAAWQAVPSARQLTGPTSEELRAELAALPAHPTGDIEVHQHVHDLAGTYQRILAVASAHEDRKPADVDLAEDTDLAAAAAAGPSTLRQLAVELNSLNGNGMSDVPGLALAVNTARQQRDEIAAAAQRTQQEADAAAARLRELSTLARPAVARMHGGSTRTLLFEAAGIAAAVGVVLLVVGQMVPGVALLAVALLAGVAGGVVSSRRNGAPVSTGPSIDHVGAAAHAQQTADVARQARQELFDADRFLADQEGRHAAAVASANRAEQARADVHARCTVLHVPADATKLHELAARVERLAELRAVHADWEAERKRLADQVEEAGTRLRSVLTDRGVTAVDVDITDLLARYESDCIARAEQAVKASQRGVLMQSLADREAAESAVAEAKALRVRAQGLLQDAAQAAGMGTAHSTEPEDLLAALGEWQRGWEDQVKSAEEERATWAELVSLLDGARLDDLMAQQASLEAEHAELLGEAHKAADIATEALRRRDELAAPLGTTGGVEAVNSLLAEARANAEAASTEARDLVAKADQLGGARTERARVLPSVPEAEEAVAAARAELARVTELAATLDLTKKYLSGAQERVHRDIAPVLAGTLRTWLPDITDGRYVDATLDPATLGVKVCGSSRHWREADRLSVGTAEQVYLLLRFALAQHLAVTGETCPLLLDDVTVQADDVRTSAILDLLLQLSEHRQVVLFAQESAVLDWARTHLDDDRHALRQLTPVAAG